MHRVKNFYHSLTRGERRTLTIALACAAVGIIGSAASWYIAGTKSVPAAGGSYREGIVGQPAYVNPVTAKSPADKALTALLFSNVKDLADRVELADNGRTVKIHLKENLHWSDGEEITSDDVIFTVATIQNPDAGSPLFATWQGVVLKRISKLEVDLALPGTYAFIDDNLANLRPIPKHLFANIPPANWKLSEYNTRPVGSGPYLFVSRAISADGFITSYRLRANPSSPTAPYITTFEIAFFKNRADLLASFNRGTIDGFFLSDPSGLSDVKRPYQGIRFMTPTYYAVFWNQSASTALGQPEVRKVLAAAVNTADLTKAVLGDYGAPATDPFSPVLLPPLASTSTSSSTPQDILERNGWKRGDDGLYAKKIGKATVPLSFTLLTPDVPFLVQTANALRDAWERIGASVTVETKPLDEILAGPVKNRTYEAALFGNTLTRGGDAFSFWHSSQRLYPGLNLALYQNASADRLIEKIRSESDPAARAKDMDALRTQIVKDNAALFLFSPVSVYVTTKDLRGAAGDLISDASDHYANVASWYVTTKRVKK